MNNEIKFTVPGNPQGKLRPKFFRRGKFTGTHTPKKTVNYENFIKQMFDKNYPDFEPIGDPLHLMLRIYQLIPKGTSLKKTDLMLDGNIEPAKLPDMDNILKSVFDALEGLAIKNDNQFTKVYMQKFYSRKPRLEIQINY